MEDIIAQIHTDEHEGLKLLQAGSAISQHTNTHPYYLEVTVMEHRPSVSP